MSVRFVKNNDLGTEIAEGVVLVDFYADWCGPCQMIAPILDELAVNYRGKAKIVKVNVDENPKIAQAYGVMSIPTLIMFKDAQPVNQTTGFRPKATLEGWLNEQL
ncbi:MAG: thioredoxin [Turicibacter sp.]